MDDLGTDFDAPAHLALAMSLRREEVLGLTWGDLDLDAPTLTVRRTLTYASRQLHVGPPKSDAGERTPVIPKPALAALKRQRASQGQRRLLAGESWQDRNLVVDGGNGDFWKPPSFSTYWRRFASTHGLEGVTFHALRHGAATLMLASDGWTL